MPRAKRSIQSEIDIDGLRLTWSLQREQGWCGEDKWRGIAIRVQVAGVARRELLLEYPVVRTEKDGWTRVDPQRPAIHAKRVATHIRAALEAGWDPNSRGKAFVYQVSELPG